MGLDGRLNRYNHLCSRGTVFASVELTPYQLGHDICVKDAIKVKERVKKQGFSTVLSNVTSDGLEFSWYTLSPVSLTALPSFASSICDDS